MSTPIQYVSFNPYQSQLFLSISPYETLYQSSKNPFRTKTMSPSLKKRCSLVSNSSSMSYPNNGSPSSLPAQFYAYSPKRSSSPHIAKSVAPSLQLGSSISSRSNQAANRAWAIRISSSSTSFNSRNAQKKRKSSMNQVDSRNESGFGSESASIPVPNSFFSNTPSPFPHGDSTTPTSSVSLYVPINDISPSSISTVQSKDTFSKYKSLLLRSPSKDTEDYEINSNKPEITPISSFQKR